MAFPAGTSSGAAFTPAQVAAPALAEAQSSASTSTTDRAPWRFASPATKA